MHISFPMAQEKSDFSTETSNKNSYLHTRHVRINHFSSKNKKNIYIWMGRRWYFDQFFFFFDFMEVATPSRAWDSIVPLCRGKFMEEKWIFVSLLPFKRVKINGVFTPLAKHDPKDSFKIFSPSTKQKKRKFIAHGWIMESIP